MPRNDSFLYQNYVILYIRDEVEFLVFNDSSVFQEVGYFILRIPRTLIEKNTLNGPDVILPAQTWSSFTAQKINTHPHTTPTNQK